ncbi:MAG: hypothetical protein EBX40_06660 [Gammaproteobacteria bacterium]|nr:hypothetical protein [Gammaproteobacteria bacterium]
MSFLNEVVSVCGGVNIFEGLPGFAEEVSQESVLTQNPDAIVGASPVDLSPWLSWSLIKAVKNHQLFVLPASLLVRNGPRILIGTEALCRALSENN